MSQSAGPCGVSTLRLSLATVSRVVDGLLAEGLVAEGPAVVSGRRGRAAASLATRSDQDLICGIDLGGTNCRFMLADLLGRPLATDSQLTPTTLGAHALADWIAARIQALTAGHQGTLRALAAGLPGVVSPAGLTISGAPNLPQIEGEAFAQQLARRVPAPVTLDNDSNLALLGELRFGAGRGFTNAVMFTIGTGVGAGVVLDGQLRRGRHGIVGEFGYLPAGPSGELIETLLSGSGLVSRARALGARVQSAADVFAADAPALVAPLREQFDHALLLAVTAATVAYEPEAVIIGGRLSAVIAPRLRNAKRQLRELVPAAPELLIAELGDLSGALGALAAACQETYLALGVTEADATGLPGSAAVAAIRHQLVEAMPDVHHASAV
jgi:predicted NBD/HSP70 family sugar kinase